MKKIAIFDLSITTDSPAGSCILQLIKHLSNEYQFIVFADQFENPDPQSIIWVRVPIPDKPVIARYVGFKYLAPKYYKRYIQQHTKPDLVLGTEGEFTECDICYVHFCHRAYLKEFSLKLSSPRSLARFATHHFNARTEEAAIARASTVVVPSQGLANQLCQTYSDSIGQEIETISNPIDVQYFARPKDYNAESLRQQLGFNSTDIVLVFVALGSFSRKGLDFVLGAISQLKHPSIKLLVVGGSPSEISEYARLCARLKIAESVKFVGLQSDIRAYLWSANLFVLPSSYETFSLVTFQAAIAGLPIMATQLYGVTDFLEPDVNGWLVKRDETDIAQKLKAIIKRQYNLPEMGVKACQSASKYGIPRFVDSWRSLLHQKLQPEAVLTAIKP